MPRKQNINFLLLVLLGVAILLPSPASIPTACCCFELINFETSETCGKSSFAVDSGSWIAVPVGAGWRTGCMLIGQKLVGVTSKNYKQCHVSKQGKKGQIPEWLCVIVVVMTLHGRRMFYNTNISRVAIANHPSISTVVDLHAKQNHMNKLSNVSVCIIESI